MASVESDDTDSGHTFPDSGLPDNGRGRMQVYIIRPYRPEEFLDHCLKRSFR
jgi:hypothetical protein